MTMFGCIYQLWDWLEAPPLFNAATMDAKKLQQLQQANAQKKIPLAYQTSLADYRTATHSPVFQQQQQHPYHLQQQQQQLSYQQSPTATSSSGGPLSPIDMQPQPHKLLLKHSVGGNTSSSSHSSPFHQSYTSGEQLYQSPTERTYLAAAGRLQHNPASALQQQYQQLQQAKLQAQLATQSEAAQQQQRTFALRQAMNPPVPQGHYHMSQSSSIMSAVTLQQQQHTPPQQQHMMQHQRAPPSTLNLASQFQPAPGPLKVNQKSQQQHYHQQQLSQQEHQLYAQQQLQLQLQLQHQHQLQQQHQQQQQQQQLQQHPEQQLLNTSGSEQSPVYIQQNHPGHVVNQACQTQISAVKPGGVLQKTTPSSEGSSGRSPSHAPLDRKKSIGSLQALKSPVTKRPPASPVTLSGWLYKQGSDGLKVWRKRWFVLAEYCLYYYKGPEEEKLLGSILLPSYKVSACLAEDKIYRKYAFKCEHQNMRTYWLAAETADAMVQWVRALTAATMMQAPSSCESDQNSQPSASSSLNHSGENSDSGIHTLQSQQSKMSLTQGQVTPASDNGALGGNAANAGPANASTGGGGAQPLYANAPPKPRRITDGGYSSPSPEQSIDNERKPQQYSSRRSGVMSPTLQQMQQQQQYHQQQQQHQQQRAQQPQQHHVIYDARTGNVSSALRLQQQQQQYSVDNLEAQFQQQVALAADDFAKASATADSHADYNEVEEQMRRLQQQQQRADNIYGDRELYMQKLIQQRYPPHLGTYPNTSAERRMPDAYGRPKNRLFTDYEDIYNMQQGAGAVGATSAQEALLQEAASYRRPLSPPSYDGSKHVPAMPSRYTPNHLEATGSNSNLRARPAAAIVRPHSADFLEYEARVEAAADAMEANAAAAAAKPDPVRAPRPKSSLDINRTPDSFYYSEASYAEKMRKSALYLQHPQAPTGAQPQQAAGYRAAPGDCLSPVGGGTNTISYENPYERAHKRSELLSDALVMQGAASIPRMSRSMGGAGGDKPSSGGSAHTRSASLHPHTQHSSSQQQQQSQQHASQSSYYSPSLSTQQIIQQNEQFLRSASARLPKRSGGFDEDYGGSPANAAATSPPQTSNTGNASLQQDGERKREESMKRLLEWKQRMLQSPLTRKGIQQAQAGGGSNMSAMSKLGSNPNILLASTTVASGAHYGPQAAAAGASAGAKGIGGSMVGGVSGIQRSRSETHANVGPLGYNSYSSDDEDGTVLNAPAGRSTTTTTAAIPHTQVTTATATGPAASGSAGPSSSNKYNATKTTIATSMHLTQHTLTSATNNNTNNNKNNIIAGNASTATVVIPTPKTLKPILKVTDANKLSSVSNILAEATDLTQAEASSSTTRTAAAAAAITAQQKPRLHLNMAALKSTDDSRSEASATVERSSKTQANEMLAEVPILPKKPAPKSPQITSYIPVYSTKTLISGSGALTKNYENVDMIITEDKQEVEITTQTTSVDIKETRKEVIPTEVSVPHSTLEKESIEIASEDETPMLKNLQIFKEALEAKRALQQATGEQDLAQSDLKIKLPECTEEDKHEDEDAEDDDTACEEYTDDDLDEALAEEADAEDESATNEPANMPLQLQLPDKHECAKIYENEPMESFDENHYLPMTPKKTEFGASGGLTLISKFVSVVEEENHYVKMTKGLSEEDLRSNYETMCLGGGSTAAESISKAVKHFKMHSEPVYMELPNTKPRTVITAATPAEDTHNASGKSTLKKNKKVSGDTLKKKSKKSAERCQSKRKDLPDILKPSQSTLAMDSDSSDDADDESSKHMDSKKMRSRSRFSLSDTFRPASYYLGASTPLANCAESSDSEIVSPPPIPLSPPPMEELKTEEIFSSEIYDTVKRRDSNSNSNNGSKLNLSYDQLPKMHASNTSLNLPKAETALKCSRLSLPDQFSKVRSSGHLRKPHSTSLLKQHERTLSDSNYSFQTDNSSNTSSDFDLYNKLKQTSPSFVASPARYKSNSSLTQRYISNVLGTGDSSETDSVEFRQRQGSDSELERQRSRRPLSEESISEIESLNEKFEDALNAPDLDTYLNQLQNSDLYLYQNTSSFETASSRMNDVTAVAGAGKLTNLIKPPEIFRTEDDEHFYGNMHFMSSTDSLQKLVTDVREDVRRHRSALPDNKNALSDSSSTDLLGATSLTPTSMDQEHNKFLTPLHSRNNSNISEQSAPYYYSELSSSREMLSTPTTLNNQRDVHVHSGSNIAHIHNPIERHSITVETLADKDQAIDSKNLYKMKPNVEKLSYSSGKNLRTSESLLQQTVSSSTRRFRIQPVPSAQLKQNNFQTNLGARRSELTSSPMHMTMPIMQSHTQLTFPYPSAVPVTEGRHAKNTNVQLGNSGTVSGDGAGEGEGAGAGAGEGERTSRRSGPLAGACARNRPSNASKFTVLGAPASGELLWEEDTLWRESLRRVSQRHARSLDDLDRIASPLVVAHAERSDYTISERLGKSKLTRDVTYVNDDISQKLRSSSRGRLNSAQRAFEASSDEPNSFNEHDVYVQLMAGAMQLPDMDEVYEMLREDTSSNLSSNISHKSSELDRETIRQWDSMSSGLMKNSASSGTNQEPNEVPDPTAVKSIIQQLNANSEAYASSSDAGSCATPTTTTTKTQTTSQ